VTTELEAVKAAIDQLDRDDREKLRPWMLAVFHADGNFSRPFHSRRAQESGLE
jgi:hypothetical protein